MPPSPATPGSATRRVLSPLWRFLQVEAAGGVVLAGAVLVALVWSSSPWSDSYERLWSVDLAVTFGGHTVGIDLRHAVDDGLMTLFFFVIGLEIKRELTDGHLASVRAAAVPALGALGGMVVPALVYLAVNAGGDGARGWGIPLATDVAFAVGVLALLGPRVPAALKALLLALAIVDDIGAVVVIAVVYSGRLDLRWAAVAVAGLAGVVALRVAGVRAVVAYVAVGSVVWWGTWQSGVHATLAGVVLGLLTPAVPHRAEPASVAERLQDRLHPWTSFVIVPAFALANAGLGLTVAALGDAVTSPVTLGVVAGLVVGKPVGIVGAIALATWLGVGRLPGALSARHVVGLGALAGIGFTVSLFIAGRAFAAPALADQAKVGIFAASVLAAGLGAVILRGAAVAAPPGRR